MNFADWFSLKEITLEWADLNQRISGFKTKVRNGSPNFQFLWIVCNKYVIDVIGIDKL